MKIPILIHLHTKQRVVLCNNMISHDRSVDIVTGRPNNYRLTGFSQEPRFSSFPPRLSSEALREFCERDKRALSQDVKWMWCETHYSLPSEVVFMTLYVYYTIRLECMVFDQAQWHVCTILPLAIGMWTMDQLVWQVCLAGKWLYLCPACCVICLASDQRLRLHGRKPGATAKWKLQPTA
jgi:hypothetical protein